MKIILDTDIGDDIDDAYALNLLLSEEKTELLGITTVYRNSIQRAKIVKTFLDFYNKDIPVYAGEDFPIKEPLKPFDKAEKDKNGIWGIPHFDSKKMNDKTIKIGAVDFIANALNNNPNEITLVAIGPLTNIAKVAKKYPQAFKKAKELYMMGGDYSEDKPEWNILCDPESAEIVFKSGIKIKAFGLDITRKCTVSKERIEELEACNTEQLKLLISMTKLWVKHNEELHIKPTMHDPITVCELNNNFCSFKKEKVTIGIQNDSRGKTIVGEVGTEIEYAIGCDYEKMLSYMWSKLKRA